ncbi:MAG TPA: Maf family protein, partial [Gaiellaceae bacterium]|nr:Maf family protein [Gaiellaceae bacterium]
EVARRGDLGGAQAIVSAPPAPPILLASTSPQRRAILEQLQIPFDAVEPRYQERDSSEADAVELVKTHAEGKARSVADEAGERPVLGVDTAVVLGGRIYGKAETAEDAAEMLDKLGGETHMVVSGLCLLTPAWQVVDHEATRVQFRALTPRDIAHYVASGEWEGRAGAYAIQGLGGSLVEELEGDYLNVVGLPATLLVRLLAERFAGVYGFG